MINLPKATKNTPPCNANIRTKAKLRGGKGIAIDLFSTKNAVLPISVNQPYHEGEKFEATLKTIETRFDTIGVDTPEDLEKVKEKLGKK